MIVVASGYHADMPSHVTPFTRFTAPIRAVARAVVFFLKVFPMLPSRPVDWLTRPPQIVKVHYPTTRGLVEGELYRPPTDGPHPGIVVCLGVVPFGVEHPQVAVLGRALARSGFVALLYWSPAMRDFRLDPDDIESIALAYRWLTDQPFIDASRSGLLGTCVGGSFAIMSAASPLIQDRVAFVAAYAPFSSMRTFAGDIASASRTNSETREPWRVDQLTRRVFVHSLTDQLDIEEAGLLRAAFADGVGSLDVSRLSAEGRSVHALLTIPSPAEAAAALKLLPSTMQDRLASLSPVNHLAGLRAPLITVLHDVGDQVIPIGESRRLISALDGRVGLLYTEMQFQHLDPTRGRLPPLRLAREFGKFFRAVLPLFRQAVA